MATDYQKSEPLANKMLNADGSVTLLTGAPIDPATAIMKYKKSAAFVNKVLMPDGSMLTLSEAFPGGGGGGGTGFNGWSPILGIIPDGVRNVLIILDWVGGTGTKPQKNLYIGSAGFVENIQDAQDIRGLQGEIGPSGAPVMVTPRGYWDEGTTDYTKYDVAVYVGPDETAHSYIYMSDTSGSRIPPLDQDSEWVIWVMQGPTGKTGPVGGPGPAGRDGDNGAPGFVSIRVDDETGDIFVAQQEFTAPPVPFRYDEETGNLFAVVGQVESLLGRIATPSGHPGSNIGEIFWWPLTVPPEDSLYCDGRAVSRTEYSQLFNVVGTQFGEGDGSTTFNLPDMRGEFVRGYDPEKLRDPSGDTRGIGKHQDGTAIPYVWRGANFAIPAANNTIPYNMDKEITPTTAFGSVVTSPVAWPGPTYYTSRPTNINLLPCIRYKLKKPPVDLILSPHLWPIGEELEFSDGSFGMRYTGTITSTINTIFSVDIIPPSGFNKEIANGGWWYMGGNTEDRLRSVPFGNDVTPAQWAAILVVPDIIYFRTKSNTARSNAPYDIWIRYLKY